MERTARAVLIGFVMLMRIVWAEDACGNHPETSDCARILSNLGSLYYSQARYREAEPLFERAIALWSTHDQKADLAITLHDLAAVYRAEARYPEAIRTYERALDLRESLNGPKAVSLVPLLNGLGAVYMATGTPKRAERLFHRAEVIDLANLQPRDVRLGYDDYNAALAALGRNQNAVAEARFQACLSIFGDRLPANDPDTGNATAGLAEVFRRQERWKESATLYRKALDILERSWGPDDPRLAAILESYSEVLRTREDYAEAESIDTQAMKIRVIQALRGSH